MIYIDLKTCKVPPQPLLTMAMKIEWLKVLVMIREISLLKIPCQLLWFILLYSSQKIALKFHYHIANYLEQFNEITFQEWRALAISGLKTAMGEFFSYFNNYVKARTHLLFPWTEDFLRKSQLIRHFHRDVCLHDIWSWS